MLDKFKDECGVFGIFGHPEAANLTYLGLYALQHRGQESAGIVCADGQRVRLSRSMGEVADSFDQRHARGADRHMPPSATSATRRRARAASRTRSRCSSTARTASSAIGHNGNLVNASELRDELVRQGSIFQTTHRHRGHRPPLRAVARRRRWRARSSRRSRRCAAPSRW